MTTAWTRRRFIASAAAAAAGTGLGRSPAAGQDGWRAGPLRHEHRTDPAHHTAPQKHRQALEHLRRPAAKAARYLRERLLADGEVAPVHGENLPINPFEVRPAGI